MARTGPNFKRFIESITITNAGSSYSSSNPPAIVIGPPNILATDGEKIQATASLEISNAIVDSVTIVEPGDGYKNLPDVYLIGSVHTTDTISIVSGGTANEDRESLAGVKTVDIIPAMVTRSLEGTVTLTETPQVRFTVAADGSISSVSWYTSSGSRSGYGFAEGDVISIIDTNFGGIGETPALEIRVDTISQGGSGAVLTPSVMYLNKPQQYFHQNFSYIAEFQIPEWVRIEYPKYASFIKSYFSFLDADDTYTESLGLSSQSPNYVLQELLDRFSVSHYHGDFLETLLQQYCIDFPEDKSIDTRFLIKRIRDFYTAKGSRRSIETFFKMVYGEEVEVFRPSEYVLRASDGVWNKEVTIKVYENREVTPVFNPLELRGRKIDIYYYESTASITARKRFQSSVLRAEKIAYTIPSAYELTVDLPPDTTIPGYGVEGELEAVIGGKISTLENIGTADVLRSDSGSPYTIGTSDYTTDGNGSLATFEVTVDGSGAASVTVTAPGDNFAPGETITIPDSNLGGGGAVDLTFDIATITDGKIFSVTIANDGQGYSANPLVNIIPDPADTIATNALLYTRLTGLDKGGEISSVFIQEAGSGYNHTPILTLSTDTLRSYVALPDTSDILSNKKAFLTRVLNTSIPTTYSAGADGGFKVGDTFQVSESGDILGVYALDYFAEDYTLTGIENKAYIRIKTVNGSNYPTAIDIIATGTGFQRAQFNFTITSALGETTILDCHTGFSHTYPGQFKNSRGFLSDANRLQDNGLYQSFSYQIKSALSKSQWGPLLTRTAHPAGMVAFSDFQIEQTVGFAGTFNIIPDIFVFRVFANVEVLELSELVAKFVHKPNITDSFATQDDEAFLEPGLVKTENPDASDAIDKFDVTMLKTDSSDMSELVEKAISKPTITDSVDLSELVELLLQILRNPVDTVDMSEIVTRVISINKTDNATVDDNSTLTTGLTKTDTPDVSDVPIKQPGLSKDDTTDLSETVVYLFGMNEPEDYSVSDTGVLIIQNYAGDYFAEDYVGDARSF